VVGKGGQSSVDDTASAIQALVAGGRKSSRNVKRAVGFLRRSQNPDGGFPLSKDGPSNAQSASYAVQAFVAAGRDPDRVRRGGSRSVMAYLRSLTTGSGAVRYSRTSAQTPVWVTAQAAMALARKSLPLKPVARRAGAGGGAAAAAGGGSGPGAGDGTGSSRDAGVPPAGSLLRLARDLGAAVGLAMLPLT
jgi:hypothetical protein